MRRPLLALVALATFVACSEPTPTGTRTVTQANHLRTVVAASGTLDENIQSLIALWPGGESNALLKQWTTIKRLYEDGQTNSDKLAAAQAKLVELTALVIKKTDVMNEPEGDETKSSAASRLVLYMALYVYGGPLTEPPDFVPGGNNAVGVLTPDAPLTLVTPDADAGVHFDEGSVSGDRIIVVSQNPTQYGPCDGPLTTNLCQYPLYFNIESFPDGPLLKVAQAEVCHPAEDAYGGPPDEATHDRLRLAHTKPANSANYVPGGTIRDVPAAEENIEILPLISQSFLPSCEGIVWEQPPILAGSFLQRGVRLASSIASRVGRFLAPRTAYAIDQGGGGEFEVFSPFNNVDPLSELYALDGSSGNLRRVNASTGASSLVGALGVGQVPALAVDPTTGTMYAGHGAGTPTLYTVNPTNGAATLVGNSGLGFAAISSLAFRSDGVLFAAVNIAGDGGTGADHLATINKTTGIATVIGSFGSCTGVVQPTPNPAPGSCTIEGIEGIAFDGSGTLWGAHSTRGIAGAPGLYTINTGTGAATFVSSIVDGSSNPASGGIVSLAFGSNGQLFGGTARAINPATDGGYLVTINPSTGVFTPIGQSTTGSSLSALAFR